MPKKSNKIVPDSSAEEGNTEQPLPRKGKQCSPAIHWTFTWNNYKPGDIRLLQLRLAMFGKYVFQEEIGEEKGTPHIQGYFMFNGGKKKRWTALHLPKQIHWEAARDDWDAENYAQKLDTRAGPVRTNLPKFKDYDILSDDQLDEWMLEVIRITEGPTDYRTINWIWDRTGNMKKTAFATYMCVVKGAMLVSGKGDNMKEGIVNYMEAHKGRYPEIIIVNIPRAAKDFVSYAGIEEMKDACFFSGKYHGSMVIGASRPHIICLANQPPNVEEMSKDRWNILELGSPQC